MTSDICGHLRNTTPNIAIYNNTSFQLNLRHDGAQPLIVTSPRRWYFDRVRPSCRGNDETITEIKKITLTSCLCFGFFGIGPLISISTWTLSEIFETFSSLFLVGILPSNREQNRGNSPLFLDPSRLP